MSPEINHQEGPLVKDCSPRQKADTKAACFAFLDLINIMPNQN